MSASLNFYLIKYKLIYFEEILLWTKDRKVLRGENDIEMAKKHAVDLGNAIPQQVLLRAQLIREQGE